jgi:hypothetical protein
MEAAQHPALQAAVRFLAQLADVQAVHHAVHGEQHLGLVVLGINALTHRAELHAGKIQAGEKRKRVRGRAGKPGSIIHQDGIERPARVEGCAEQPLEAWPVGAGAA